uniref:Chromosome transmission fidelity protein 8 n=1 Tax=Rhodosporidiobolus colostri TaxID=255053 RepID=A0A9E9JW50_9BASI|nr:hypothetical protein [Rhodosporidiobolus colostri]
MRLELTPTAACTLQLSSPSSSSSDPPLVFIDEPFLIEFQGKLELPPGESEQAAAENTGGDEMEGARVGKVDLSDPKKPILRIAHHRLEGKLETLLTPYALLRTTRLPPSSSDPSSSSAKPAASDASALPPPDDDERASKRAKLDDSSTSNAASSSLSAPSAPSSRIEILSVIRRKIVFSRRPEPLIDVSSEADPAQSREQARKNKPHPMARLGGSLFAEAGGKGAVGGGGKKS